MAEKDKKPDKQDKRKPYKFSPEKKEAYLLALGEGMTRGKAAESVGVHRETIRVHRNEDPAFDEACEDAELDAHVEIEDALFKAATTGNVTACIFYLKNRCPERWKDVNRFEGAVQQDQHTVHHMADEKIDEHRAGVLRRIMGIPEDVCEGQPVDSPRAPLVAVETPEDE